MGRYTFPAFNKAPTPRYVVVWDLHWTLIECQRLEPAAHLSSAIAAALLEKRGVIEIWRETNLYRLKP